ncbi:MAG: serine hydrolase domain-containing protein [Pseudomonadota bacterium]
MGLRFREVLRCARAGWVHALLIASLAWIAASCSQPGSSDQTEASLADRMAALQIEHPDVPGFSIVLQLDDDTIVSAATGVASPDGTPMLPETPVRIASITKTFVAATVLSLMEDGLLDLDAPIAGLITPAHNDVLIADGYDTEAIKVRHLLTHVSGMPDHAGERYIQMVVEEPDRVWTRADQIEVLVTLDDPLGTPATRFKYSDTGYVLLGDIIERTAGEPLPAVVRERMKFADLGLDHVWWDELEPETTSGAARAHQYMEGMPTFELNGTMDAYGGGGLVASTEDMVRFYRALFEGKIFNSAETLEMMITAPGHPFPDSYRFGLFPTRIDDIDAFSHSGFWGTYAIHVPELGITAAGVALDQSGYRAMRSTIDEIIAECGRDEHS